MDTFTHYTWAGPNGDQGSQGNNQHSGLNTIRKTECAVGSFRLQN